MSGNRAHGSAAEGRGAARIIRTGGRLVTRIVLVGAGSVEFTRNLLGDFLAYPELRDATIALHDIDPDRLRTAERMARWTAAALGAEPVIEAHLDRRSALRDADVVVNTIQVGGAAATRLDFEIPSRYGLRYTINDTINVGGVFRGLRSIPVVVAIARDMEELCPDAWLLNYANPLAILVRAAIESSRVKTVGLCHSVHWTVHALAEYLDVPFDEIRALSVGINHLAFVLRLERHAPGRPAEDLYPALERVLREGRLPDTDLVRGEIYRRLGYFPTESSEHHAEYSPWFIPKGDSVERFHIPIGEYLDRVSHNLDEYEATRRRLDAGEPFEIERSGEYAAVIVHSLVTGEPARIVGNVMNQGILIPDLPADACVEVPCLVDGLGVHPTGPWTLPLQCSAYLRPAVDAQALTVRAALDRDRNAIYHAVMQDPQVQVALGLDDVWRMTDELIVAEREWLPRWLGGTVAD
jgi:alpha-galactosidase